MTPEQQRRVSKLLSMVLRHKPYELGLTVDAHGWANVADILVGLAARGREITFTELEEVVSKNDKQRFSFDQTRSMLRANQGHSIPIDLELQPIAPPDVLYHGTGEPSLPLITIQGIHKMMRQHVHLSPDVETARKVGSRHGKPVVLLVNAQQMSQDGHLFFLSANGVWLTQHVPSRYISGRE